MRFFAGFLIGLLFVAIAVVAVSASGVVDVAAVKPPSRAEARFFQFSLNKSVARRAPATKNPFSPSPQVLGEGIAHYKENCVMCHGAPGVEASEAAAGLHPAAPDLTLPRVMERPDGEMFWIVSNGIKMTGMPAFSPTHKTDEIWKVVAFVRHLPEITEDEKKVLKAGTEEAEHHHEDEARSPAKTEEKGKPAGEPKPAHTHAPGTKPHKD